MNNFNISQKDYQIACKEVIEILKFVKKEDLEKLPKDEIEILNNNANIEYKFTYNPKINIKEQNVSKIAKAIIANYFIDYIATPKQKQKILNKQVYDIKNSEKEKIAIYKNNNLFKKKINKNNAKSLQITTKKEGIFEIIVNRIKSFFN